MARRTATHRLLPDSERARRPERCPADLGSYLRPTAVGKRFRRLGWKWDTKQMARRVGTPSRDSLCPPLPEPIHNSCQYLLFAARLGDGGSY